MQSRARRGAGHTLTLYTLCDYSTRAGCSHMHSWHAGRTLDITVLTPHKLCTTFQYAQYAITCTTGCWAHPHCNNDHITHFMWNYAPFVKLLNTCSVRPHARLACWAHSGYNHTNTTMVVYHYSTHVHAQCATTCTTGCWALLQGNGCPWAWLATAPMASLQALCSLTLCVALGASGASCKVGWL